MSITVLYPEDRQIPDLAFNFRRLRKSVIDRRGNLYECQTGVDLGSTAFRRRQSPLVLYESLGQHSPFPVIKRRAHAGRADVQAEDELLSQEFEVKKRKLLIAISW